MKHKERYGAIESLLITFLILGEELEKPLNDLEIIMAYIYGMKIFTPWNGTKLMDDPSKYTVVEMGNVGDAEIKRVITQGREILELEEFPEGWVYDTMNHHIINIPGVVMPKTKEWMKWVIDTLEVEAKKAGKL